LETTAAEEAARLVVEETRRALPALAASESPRHLLDLGHDVLGVLLDGLADPLQPVVAVALSSTCLGLRTPLGAALEVLKERHTRAAALCRKVLHDEHGGGDPPVPLGSSCAVVRDAEQLQFNPLAAGDMATLGMILCTGGLPNAKQLLLAFTVGFGDENEVELRALFEGMGPGSLPELRGLGLSHHMFRSANAEALAATFRRGAMPKLKELFLSGSTFSNQAVGVLAAPLRKLPDLRELSLAGCGMRRRS